MVNRYDEIAEKMPWLKKKDVPRKPWDVAPEGEGQKSAATMTAHKDDVINKIKTIQSKVNSLTVERDALTNDLEKLRKEVSVKNEIINEKTNIISVKENIIREKEDDIKGLKTQIDSLMKEKRTVDEKISDLEKALKTSTSEKLYLEQELAAADKAISEISNLLSTT